MAPRKSTTDRQSRQRHVAIKRGLVKMKSELAKLNIQLREVRLFEIVAVVREITLEDAM